ncbi:MAG: competence protein [Aeromicrobium sp.]|nr:competence protein [Aeromicrobium sp.]
MNVAAEVVAALRAAGATVATAESLTGGSACATLVAVPGASDVVRGGVVAYAPDVKTSLLGVDAALIADRGTVDAEVAAAMARGCRDRLGATYGLATTGVAGPGPAEGKRAGTVHVAIAGPHGVTSRLLDLSGDRDEIRSQTVDALLSWLVATLGEESRTREG